MKIEGSVIVLTGAAGGIGQPLAKSLATQGARMLLVDRDQQALEQLKDSMPQTDKVEIFAVDLLDSTARQALLKELQQMTPAVDMLINAAGLLSFSAFEQEDEARIEAIMTLNSIVPMQLTRALLTSMLNRDSGHIINIGSTFGSIGFAYFASYSASKFAMVFQKACAVSFRILL
jgi:short-subunit dehydrogenase